MGKATKNYVGKTLLVEKYAKKMGITVSEAEKVVNNFINLQKELLLDPQYDGIQLIGFYTIKKKHNKERICRHPKTREEIKVDANTTLKLEVGKNFKEELNK